MKPKLITLDFETYYDKDYSLAKLTTEQYIRDPRFEIIGVAYKIDDSAPKWVSFPTLEEYAKYLRPMADHFLLCHNTAFDASILGWRLGIHPKFMFDTMSMARPENQQTIGVSLKALADKYTLGQKGTEVMLALGKHRADFTAEELARYGDYCINDVQLTYILFQVLRQGFPMQELKVIDLMLRMFTKPTLVLDKAVLDTHLANVLAKKSALMQMVEQHCSKDDLMSNAKFADVLRKLGVEPPMKVSQRTGKETYAFGKTDVAFKALLDHDDPAVQAVVASRLGVKSTLEETRTQAFIGIADRGELPILLNYYGAHTGRASGGDKINLQNLPRNGALRKAITAPPGHVLVACDSSQIEARVVAWLAGETALVEDFANGVDIYSKFASRVYGRDVDRKRKVIDAEGNEQYPDKTEGHVGKTCILGLGYGMGPEKFKATLKTGSPSVDIELSEAQRIVQLYRNEYARIARLWYAGDDALYAIKGGKKFSFGANNLLYTNGEGIVLPNGMLVRYPNLMLHNRQFAYTKDRRQVAAYTTMTLTGEPDLDQLNRIYAGKVIENVVQALARIIVFDQMVAINRVYPVCLTVHDEVVCAVHESIAGEVEEFMVSEMSKAPAWAKDLPITCEAGVGRTYADAK